MAIETHSRTRLNIVVTVVPLRSLLMIAVLWPLAAPIAAQSLDSAVEAAVEAQVDEQVAEQLDAAVADAVTQAIESTVNDTVEQQVESTVAATVEQQVESSVVETIQQQVESGVVETIQQQVESGVVETIQQQVESGVVETIESQVATGVLTAIEEQAQAGIENTIDADLEDDLDINADLDSSSGLSTRAGGEARDSQSGTTATETYVAAVDATGRAIERDVWVVLVPIEYADRIESWGFTVRQRLDLNALDRVLLRVDAPEDRDIAQAALELAIDAPGTSVDLNHVYDTSQRTVTDRGISGGKGPMGRAADAGSIAAVGVEVGMIDSAVRVDHPAFQGTVIEQLDFVPFAGPRPLAHGTAVASILTGARRAASSSPSVGKIWAASVFFENAAGESVALTANLVTALDWLASAARVRVINMSLTGPANHVLEAAIDDVAARGILVVAAVGNDGPGAAPTYPAAYEPVVGITAVDSVNGIYRHANRGRYVSFAAPGVDVDVADTESGYRVATGTSMATPYAAALFAAAAAHGFLPPAKIIESFERSALDLGETGFDEVFGFGLIMPGAESALRTLQ